MNAFLSNSMNMWCASLNSQCKHGVSKSLGLVHDSINVISLHPNPSWEISHKSSLNQSNQSQ